MSHAQLCERCGHGKRQHSRSIMGCTNGTWQYPRGTYHVEDGATVCPCREFLAALEAKP